MRYIKDWLIEMCDDGDPDGFAIRLFKYFVCFILGMAVMSLIALP